MKKLIGQRTPSKTYMQLIMMQSTNESYHGFPPPVVELTMEQEQN